MKFPFYEEAKILIKKFEARGLRVIAVPFGEVDSDAPSLTSGCQVVETYQGMIGDASGNAVSLTIPATLLEWLMSQQPRRGGHTGQLRSSFEKFLVDSSGSLIRRYGGFEDGWIDDVSVEIEKLLV